MKFLRKYYYLIFILLFLIIFVVNFQSYQRVNSIILANFASEVKLIENNICNDLKNIYAAYTISELVLNQEMKQNSNILLEKYKNDTEVKNWDLEKVKLKMPDYDIYIINKDLKIINTTLKADLGLDFSTKKDFGSLLRTRLQAGKFVADKLDIAQNTALINKYSYQPTPDNKYLLELSINITKRLPVLDDFNIINKAEKLKSKYKYLKDIKLYKFNHDLSNITLINSNNSSGNNTLSNKTKAKIREAVLENKFIESKINESNYEIEDIYIPFLVSAAETDSNWWNSFILRINYDNQKLISALEREKYSFITKIILLTIVFTVFSLLMSYLINKTEEMSYYDHLTGLLNRKAFENKFNNFQNRKMGEKLAILYLDLDKFKEINDNYGHDTGDCLLKLVAERLKNNIRTNDKLSRIGGDEFTILLTNIDSLNDVKSIIKKLEKKLSEPFQIHGNKIEISCSIGYSIDYRANRTFKDMLMTADSAMYKVKNSKN